MTGAAAVLHPRTIPSSTPPRFARGGTHGGTSCSILPLRVLPQAGLGLQRLRSGSALLRHWVRVQDPSRPATRRRPTLPTQLRWTHQACLANPALARAPGRRDRAIGDASGFTSRTAGCCTACTASHCIVDVRHRGGGARPAMRHYAHDRRLGLSRLGRHPEHPRRLALPLVRRGLPTARSSWIPAPQPPQPSSWP